MLVAIIVLLLGSPAIAEALHLFQSRHYLVHTNLNREEVLDFGRKMDAIFDQYQRRFFGFGTHASRPMPLYLLRTREQYIQLLTQHDIDGHNSGGMFVSTPKFHGLATWMAGRSRSQTFITLQHEGFHQFAWNFLGHELPAWMNEGLAQYFEDAIIIGQRMMIGLANTRRIEIVRDAIKHRRTIGFSTLLNLNAQQWGELLNRDPDGSALLYAQSWSLTFFLIHGDDGKYQQALGKYLQLVSDGHDSVAAFRLTFGSEDLSPMERRWHSFAQAHQPDAINTAAARMEFLGTALEYLSENQEPMPKTIDHLKQYLQTRQFKLTTQSHGITTTLDAADDQLYVFPRPQESDRAFTLLESARNDLPPRITALGLRPEPMLVWSRDTEGQLIQEIEYR